MPFALVLGGWGKDGQIPTSTAEHMDGRLSIPDGRELAAQEIERGAMLRNRFIEINDTDAGAGFQCRGKVIKKGVGLSDLMVHVHEDRRIERGWRQARIVGLAQRRQNVTQLETPDALGQLPKVVTHDVLGDYLTVQAQQGREAYRVITAPRADIADGHAGLEVHKPNDLTGLVHGIALLFG